MRLRLSWASARSRGKAFFASEIPEPATLRVRDRCSDIQVSQTHSTVDIDVYAGRPASALRTARAHWCEAIVG